MDPTIPAVRAFNRFYTRQIGVLREGLLKSPFSLAEVRVLYEIAHRQRPSATELCEELGLDPGYLSRILRGLEKRGLVSKSPSRKDGRQSLLGMTARGRKTFATLDARQNQEVAALLQTLSPAQRARLGRPCAPLKVCSIPALNRRLRIFCARTSPATWDGSSTAMACSMPKSTDTMSASRPWWRRLRPSLSSISIPGGSVAGWLKKMARSWARYSW